VVVEVGAIGPPQPLIAVEEDGEPSLFIITKVPQKAKEVLFDPVLLKIANCNVLYTESPGVQVLHKPAPGKVALTNSKSLEGQSAGKVCADSEVKKNNSTIKDIIAGKKDHLLWAFFTKENGFLNSEVDGALDAYVDDSEILVRVEVLFIIIILR
jgi:hypothetical protein